MKKRISSNYVIYEIEIKYLVKLETGWNLSNRFRVLVLNFAFTNKHSLTNVWKAFSEATKSGDPITEALIGACVRA